jgi:uncharacterized protein (DUF2141 family)
MISPVVSRLLPIVALAVVTAATAASAQSSGKAAAGKISVMVSGLRSDQGSVRCGLYASADTFGKPGREFRGVAAPIRGQHATCVFGNIPAGTYAVAVFHAERNETRMEYGMFGKPKQGYGFSRNPSSTFGAPAFSAAAFEVRSGPEAMQVRLQY